MRRASLAPLLASMLAVLPACASAAGGSPDGGALAESFGEVAVAAYAAEDLDREEDYMRGIQVEEGCPGVDAEAIDAITAAMYGDAGEATASRGYLQGMPEDTELASCTLERGDDRMSLSYGTTPRNVRQTEAVIRRSGPTDPTAVDVDVPGLPADEVVVLQDEDRATALWVGDGFQVSVTAPIADRDTEALERLAETLGEAVDRIADAFDA